jgi:adenine phosphoribosyltransferase
VRKPGKLPSKAVSVSYSLEYGKDSLEMHDDALHPGAKVLVVDDLLATGGTLKACCELVERVGGTVGGATALIELEALGGRARIAPRDVHTVIRF